MMEAEKTPTPGIPLSAESVQERVEKIVREDFYAGPLSGSTARLASALIHAFRLTTPSDQGEAFEPSPERYYPHATTPASGSDGLETVGHFYETATGEWVQLGEEEASTTALVTREAAEKRIGELEAQVRSAVDAAQPVLSGEFSALQSQVAALKAALVEAHTELVACSEYLDPMIDADGDSEGFHPNREMTLQGGVNRAIERIDQALALKEGR